MLAAAAPGTVVVRMEGRLLVKDCTLLDRESVQSHRAVVVEAGMVARVSQDEAEPVRPGDWAIEARGRLLVPGRVDAHAELGHAPGARRALTPSESAALAAASIAVALRSGVTTVLDQVHGVTDGAAALAARLQTGRALGVRMVASLAAAGRHGIAEHEINADAARASGEDPLIRAGLGFASCLTASDELLRAVSRDAEALRAPVHFRLAESSAELAEHFEQHRTRMVERLERHGLLGPTTVAAHARAVDGAEAYRLAEASVLVAWSPLADLLGEQHGFESVWQSAHRVALASAGVGDLREQWTAGRILAHRAARIGRLWARERVPEVLGEGPAGFLERVFRRPAGRITPGAVADLILVDALPQSTDPIEVLAASMRAQVAWTVVNGRVVVREGQLLGTDLILLLTEAAAVRRAVA
jgi:5-methylthioadenosine/S-adenosylhomocysteine deaminase